MEAKVTMTMTPQELALITEAVQSDKEARIAALKASKDPKANKSHREMVTRYDDLLRKLT